MTDQRTDEDALTDPAGMTLDPAAIGAPEQPPMDDAAGGPQAEPGDAPVDDQPPADEQVAAQLGDFA